MRKHKAEYFAYHNAKYRCTNPSFKDFKNYGGRGIKFLFTSFEQFFLELGPRPKGLTLDRIENNGNYEPGNCVWATRKQQRANQRKRVYTPEGLKVLRKNGRKTGLKHGRINGRRNGRINGRKNARKPGYMAAIGSIGKHNYWHAARNIYKPGCALCRTSLKIAA